MTYKNIADHNRIGGGYTVLANALCELCLSPLRRNMISYSVFFINTEGNKNRYTSNEIHIVCRSCYLNSEKIKREGV